MSKIQVIHHSIRAHGSLTSMIIFSNSRPLGLTRLNTFTSQSPPSVRTQIHQIFHSRLFNSIHTSLQFEIKTSNIAAQLASRNSPLEAGAYKLRAPFKLIDSSREGLLLRYTLLLAAPSIWLLSTSWSGVPPGQPGPGSVEYRVRWLGWLHWSLCGRYGRVMLGQCASIESVPYNKRINMHMISLVTKFIFKHYN